MSSQTPPDKATAPTGTVRGPLQRLRALPGFKAALVTFLVTLLVGGGTVAAVATWQQSSTATIAITAGAAATTPPPLYGNIVVAPVLAVRPGAIAGEANFSCASVKNQASLNQNDADFIFRWPAAANSTSYTVSLSFTGTGYTYASTQPSLTVTSATFTLLRKNPQAFGPYVLRIQPFNGGTAGDAVYRNYNYVQNDSTQCSPAATAGPSPLGTVNPVAQAAVRGATTSAMAISWPAASGATSYVVTVKSTTSSYGTEFTTTNLSATLTFPQAARDASGKLINPADATAAYYSDYTFRIQPMNGATAGDPTYKTIKYYSASDSMG